MATIDDIIDATIRRVRASGMLTDNVLMGTVSTVGTDGTITVVRPGVSGDDTYPKVRLLDRNPPPAVGDRVEIANTNGGWVSLGRLQTSSAPRVQRGLVTTPIGSTANYVLTYVSFPVAFVGTPTVCATPVSGVTATSTTFNWAVNEISPTGFRLRTYRSNQNSFATDYSWIATDL